MGRMREAGIVRQERKDALLRAVLSAVAELESQFGEGAYPKRVLMADFPAGAALIPNPVNRGDL